VDRTTADDALSDVSASEASSGRASQRPYRRPPVQLPVPESSPTPGTTASTWFGPRVAAAQGGASRIFGLRAFAFCVFGFRA
jgi:hypothetical protein